MSRTADNPLPPVSGRLPREPEDVTGWKHFAEISSFTRLGPITKSWNGTLAVHRTDENILATPTASPNIKTSIVLAVLLITVGVWMTAPWRR